jgi:hypothetical protein
MDKYSAAYVDLSNVRELVEWEGKVCSGRSGHDRNSSDGSATCNSYMTRKNYTWWEEAETYKAEG